MPRKGYMPKYSRTKFPLTVDAQKLLIESLKGKEYDSERTLTILMISTGMHPLVLAEPQIHALAWNPNYAEWKRPKTSVQIHVNWSLAMKEVLPYLGALKGCTRQWYWDIVKSAGKAGGISGLCPLQLRHTHFVNLARMGYSESDLRIESGTNQNTISHHYLTGLREIKRLTPEDKVFLEWLMT